MLGRLWRRLTSACSPWSLGTALVLVAFAFVSAHGALDTGLSWDEDDHRAYGFWVLDWYAHPDWESPTAERMSQYGALFGVLCGLLERALPDVSHIALRHLCSAAFALIGLVFALRAALALGGPSAGFFTALVLSTMPRWTGHAMFNPIDIPFAAGMAAALDALVRLTLELPKPRVRRWIWLGVATGAGLGVRVGGVLVLGYAALLLVSWVALGWRNRSPEAPPRASELRGLCAGFAAVVVLAYASAGLVWPYLLTNPWSHTLELLRSATSFPWRGSILFGGELIDSYQPPKSYLPTWFAITSPPLCFFALAVLVIGLRAFWPRERSRRLAFSMLCLASVFPPLYALASGAILYDGLRHFLFVLPPIAVVCGWSIAALVERCQSVRLRLAVLGVASCAAAEPVVWLVRAHPFSYTYFNPFAGGLARASHDYETDYWGVTLRAAAEWIAHNRAQLAPDGELVVGSNVSWHLLAPWLADVPGARFWSDSREPAHVVVEHYRHRPPGWHERGTAVYEARWSADQVPFFRIHVGSRAARPSAR